MEWTKGRVVAVEIEGCTLSERISLGGFYFDGDDSVGLDGNVFVTEGC